MAGDLRGESGGEGRGQQAAKRRAHRLKEALQVYDAAEAAEDAAEDALAEHLAAWRVSSFSGGASSVKHAASLADVPSLAPCDRLDLSGRGLAVLEARHLRGLTHLLELSLVGNRLASLPRTLAQMPNLRSLNLGANELSTLPDLSSLGSLVHVGLSYNHLGSLDGLGALLPAATLRSLDLSFNRLGSLRVAIEELCAPAAPRPQPSASGAGGRGPGGAGPPAASKATGSLLAQASKAPAKAAGGSSWSSTPLLAVSLIGRLRRASSEPARWPSLKVLSLAGNVGCIRADYRQRALQLLRRSCPALQRLDAQPVTWPAPLPGMTRRSSFKSVASAEDAAQAALDPADVTAEGPLFLKFELLSIAGFPRRPADMLPALAAAGGSARDPGGAGATGEPAAARLPEPPTGYRWARTIRLDGLAFAGQRKTLAELEWKATPAEPTDAADTPPGDGDDAAATDALGAALGAALSADAPGGVEGSGLNEPSLGGGRLSGWSVEAPRDEATREALMLPAAAALRGLRVAVSLVLRCMQIENERPAEAAPPAGGKGGKGGKGGQAAAAAAAVEAAAASPAELPAPTETLLGELSFCFPDLVAGAAPSERARAAAAIFPPRAVKPNGTLGRQHAPYTLSLEGRITLELPTSADDSAAAEAAV